MTVWKAATTLAPPKNMAIFGSSAGGNLTLAMVLRARQDKLPLPAAIAPGTPMSDLTGAGDSFQTNAMLDNVLVAYGANCDKRAALYTNGRDLRDPMLSPVYGDLRGFPPAILTTGQRELGRDDYRSSQVVRAKARGRARIGQRSGAPADRGHSERTDFRKLVGSSQGARNLRGPPSGGRIRRCPRVPAGRREGKLGSSQTLARPRPCRNAIPEKSRRAGAGRAHRFGTP